MRGFLSGGGAWFRAWNRRKSERSQGNKRQDLKRINEKKRSAVAGGQKRGGSSNCSKGAGCWSTRGSIRHQGRLKKNLVTPPRTAWHARCASRWTKENSVCLKRRKENDGSTMSVIRMKGAKALNKAVTKGSMRKERNAFWLSPKASKSGCGELCKSAGRQGERVQTRHGMSHRAAKALAERTER